MRVLPTSSASSTHEVEAKQTSVSRDELRTAIGRALVNVTGKAANPKTVDVLTAHASLETASGARMFNFNFGGIKGASPAGETARYKTHEVLGGKDVVIRDGFRAYNSLEAGATDYVRLMHNRFGSAMSAADRGDIDGFAHALKASGYYTADEKTYATALHGLTGGSYDHAPSSHVMSVVASNMNLGLPDSNQVEAFMNSLSRHRPIVEDDFED